MVAIIVDADVTAPARGADTCGAGDPLERRPPKLAGRFRRAQVDCQRSLSDAPKESVSQCALVSSRREHRRDTLAQRSVLMSASHHPTDVHLRQHRAKKRNKLRAR